MGTLKVDNIQTESGTSIISNGLISASSNVGKVKLAEVNSVSSVSSFEISIDYSSYEDFELILYLKGDSSSSTINGTIQFKRDGQGSFDSGQVYGYQYSSVDVNNTHANVNGTGTFVQFYYNQPDKGFNCNMTFNGFGSTTRTSSYHSFTNIAGGGTTNSSYHHGGGYDTEATAKEKVTDLKFAFATGNVTEVRYKLYGIT
tara:strand:+ start:190 stop:792 length:603 start_codon:yes stop_codon:yes gene_type:complete